MKKQTFLVMMILTAGLVFAQQGIVKDMIGTVELKPAGASAFVPAKPGDRVAPNTIISTGFKSIAVISVGSTTLSVQALTRLSLAEISQTQGKEELNVNLQAGRVRVEVRPPVGTRADTSVRTPSATASVRGTVFEIDTMWLFVNKGIVAYWGNDGRIILISAGGTSRIDPVTGRPVDPIETNAANLLPPAPAGTDQLILPAGTSGASGASGAAGSGPTVPGGPATGTVDFIIDY
jgi:hypothetical protein